MVDFSAIAGIATSVCADVLGEDARAIPASGEPFDVSALRDAEPELVGFEAPRRRPAIILIVAVADWPTVARDDQIEIAGETRRIADVSHEDELRLSWRLETEAT